MHGIFAAFISRVMTECAKLPGLTSIHQKCLSYNSIHQVYEKFLVEKRYKLISAAV